MKKEFLFLFLLCCVYSAVQKSGNETGHTSQYPSDGLGRIGDYGYPDNPQLDRAKGYLLKGKVKSAVLNYGNYITWDYHPAGMWSAGGENFGYLPNVTFIAGVPGHVYSSKWSSVTYLSWIQEQKNVNSEDMRIWSSHDAYLEWMEDSEEYPRYEGNFAGIVYNTIDDRGELATRRPMGANDVLDSLVIGGGIQWILDKVNEKVILYLEGLDVDPNYAQSLIGLAYPWAIRPKLVERTDNYDKFDYGDDTWEWNEDDNYTYYGASSIESWFIRDGGSQPQKDTDWQAAEKSRFNTHNTEQVSGELFGETDFTDPDDPDRMLAHSQFSSTWPEKYVEDTGDYERVWPGWWADEYYGENEAAWSQVGITNCERNRLDDDCWKPLKGRHISDMDVYMEFDDRWAEKGNRITNNQYDQTGYPLGLKVMSMAHSYGISYAEDIMFVTVQVRNESGDFCAFMKDADGFPYDLMDVEGHLICGQGMIMPDGTKLNRDPETGQGMGFDYKDMYLGFYMDADVLTTDANGNFSVHTNPDDFMTYLDCLNDELGIYYPDGCPIINDVPLRISMAVIGDWDGESNSAMGYSMETGESKGPDFGVVAVQLLDSPYATEPVDLNGDTFMDIYPGEKLKMTDWHWFDWYNRPGVVSRESDTNCCAGDKGRPQARNKELIQYKVMSGDINNLSSDEKLWFFHTANPCTDTGQEGCDMDANLNPHFDKLEGLERTSFFADDPEGLDCVLEMSTGPFNLDVGETVSFSFAIIFGQNIDDLKQNAKFAQIMYNSHYQGYTAPLTPTLLTRPSHNKVELLWDDIAELSKDVITGYTDFEGYKIYKSVDGGNTWGLPEDEIRINNIAEGWQPYAQFDLSDSADYYFPVTHETIRGASISGPDPSAPWFNLGNDVGLENLLLDPECWDCASLNSELFNMDWERKCDAAPHCESSNNECVVNSSFGISELNCNPDSALVCDDDFNCCGISHAGFTLQDFLHGTGGIASQMNEINAPQCYKCSIDTIDTKESCDDFSGEWGVILNGEFTGSKYKFIDDRVFDGIEYTYSVSAYDVGVIPTVTAFIDTFDAFGNQIGYVPTVISIPDPGGWGKDNSFRTLESPKGTSVQDRNFSKVIPGHESVLNLNNVIVVPNPYIVDSKYNETIYKKKLRFTRLVEACTITIFTISGERVQTLKHNISPDYDGNIADTGNEWWDLRSYNNQEVAPGLYIYIVESETSKEKFIGKFAVVR